jgi:hypothetical protein
MKTFKEFLAEAKQEQNLSPLEKEDVRNKRATGTTQQRDKQTGLRRWIHNASRGAKDDKKARDDYRTDPGNLPDTKKEVRERIQRLKGFRRGRMFSRFVRGELSDSEARALKNEITKKDDVITKKKNDEYVAVRNAQNLIKRFKR